jgi:TRAP-type mannitol/chloroaromatic compound transport system permease large subunit
MTDDTTIPPIIKRPIPPILPQWQNRRQVIRWSLLFCGGAAAAVVSSACGALFLNILYKVTIDSNLIQLLTTILYTSAFVSTSIIGSYVFGANFDYANSRAHISNFFNQPTKNP